MQVGTARIHPKRYNPISVSELHKQIQKSQKPQKKRQVIDMTGVPPLKIQKQKQLIKSNKNNNSNIHHNQNNKSNNTKNTFNYIDQKQTQRRFQQINDRKVTIRSSSSQKHNFNYNHESLQKSSYGEQFKTPQTADISYEEQKQYTFSLKKHDSKYLTKLANQERYEQLKRITQYMAHPDDKMHQRIVSIEIDFKPMSVEESLGLSAEQCKNVSNTNNKNNDSSDDPFKKFLPQKKKFRTYVTVFKNSDHKRGMFAIQVSRPEMKHNIEHEHKLHDNALNKALQKLQDIQNNDEETHNIFMPKPTTKYCFVCKAHFEEYMEHIKTRIHQSNDKSAKAWVDIRNLCKKAQDIFFQQNISHMNLLKSLDRQEKKRKSTQIKKISIQKSKRQQEQKKQEQNVKSKDKSKKNKKSSKQKKQKQKQKKERQKLKKLQQQQYVKNFIKQKERRQKEKQKNIGSQNILQSINKWKVQKQMNLNNQSPKISLETSKERSQNNPQRSALQSSKCQLISSKSEQSIAQIYQIQSRHVQTQFLQNKDLSQLYLLRNKELDTQKIETQEQINKISIPSTKNQLSQRTTKYSSDGCIDQVLGNCQETILEQKNQLLNDQEMKIDFNQMILEEQNEQKGVSQEQVNSQQQQVNENIKQYDSDENKKYVTLKQNFSPKSTIKTVSKHSSPSVSTKQQKSHLQRSPNQQKNAIKIISNNLIHYRIQPQNGNAQDIRQIKTTLNDVKLTKFIHESNPFPQKKTVSILYTQYPKLTPQGVTYKKPSKPASVSLCLTSKQQNKDYKPSKKNKQKITSKPSHSLKQDKQSNKKQRQICSPYSFKQKTIQQCFQKSKDNVIKQRNKDSQEKDEVSGKYQYKIIKGGKEKFKQQGSNSEEVNRQSSSSGKQRQSESDDKPKSIFKGLEKTRSRQKATSKV